MENTNLQFTNAINYFCKQILNELVVDCLRLVDPETGKLKNGLTTQEVLWIGGGAVRDYFSKGYVKDTDYDIYFINQETMETCLNWLLSNQGKLILENQNVCKLSWKGKEIDIIKRYYPEGPENSFNDYDFTICCAAITRENVYYRPTYFIDLAKKALVMANGSDLVFPLSTMWRTQKYIKKGFSICRGGLLDIAVAINKLDLSNVYVEKSPLHIQETRFQNKETTFAENFVDSTNSNGLEFYLDGTPKFNGID